MAKIVRKHQKIFAGGVPVTNVVAKFGSLAIGSVGYTGNPDGIQTTEWDGGWSEAVINNYAPCIQDFNALFYVLTYQLAYLFQAGISEWAAGTTYYKGSLVTYMGTGEYGNIYMSMIDDNINYDVSLQDKWVLLLGRNIAEVGDNYTVAANIWVVLWSTANPTSGHETVTLPAPTSINKGREIIVKVTKPVSSANVIIVASGGSTIDGAANATLTSQYTYKRFICDGTNWHTA